MKSIIFLSLLASTSMAMADESITPLEMKPGHWTINTEVDQSAMMEKLLASVPEAQHAMIKETMQKKMQSLQSVDQCITEEMIKNYDEQIKKSLGASGAEDSCTLDVAESTSKKFAGTVTCSGQAINISTVVINSKRNESTVLTEVPGMGQQKVLSIAEWQADTCPAGVN